MDFVRPVGDAQRANRGIQFGQWKVGRNTRAAVHLNALGKRLRDRALAYARGEPVIIFMGGQATGKTTGALALGPAFGAVFDAPHTDPDGVAFLLGRIRQAGCSEVHLAYTDRDPEGALKAMLARSEREGRYVPLDRMARAHAWAPFTFLGLAPRVGRNLQQGEAFAVVESVKAASDVYAPVAGTVVAVNEALAKTPELINQDPYGSGWIVRIKPSAAAGAAGLLDASAYATLAEAG